MTDREKAIRILEGNYKSFVLRHNGELLTGNELIALLKAQEPRVMTLDEIHGLINAPMWRETKSRHKDLYNGWMLAYDIQKGMGITGVRLGMCDPSRHMCWCKLDDYGKTWRCWNAEPTDEQREAVKWDDK